MFNIVVGLVAIAIGILTAITWGWRVVELIQGLIPLVLMVGGAIAAFAGWEITKERALAEAKNAREMEEENNDK